MKAIPLEEQSGIPQLWVIDLGQKEYISTRHLQLELVEARLEDRIPDVLLLVEHNPVFTMGRHGDWANLLISKKVLQDQGVRCIQIERGGDITYHGPGQLVGYPIIKVAGDGRKVKALVTKLEDVLLFTLSRFGLHGERNVKNPGIWINTAKIGAIGMAIRHGISFHGFALNVNIDLNPFSWIHPCGLPEVPVTSMKQLHAVPTSMEEVKETVYSSFCRIFGYQGRCLMARNLEKALISQEEKP